MLQLSIWNLPTVSSSTPTSPFTLTPVAHIHALPNLKLATKLEKLAAGMEKTIQGKLNPAIADQNLTPRRARIAEGMREEGQKLAMVQNWLQQLAKRHREGNCPTQLAKIVSRDQLLDFTTVYQWQLKRSGNIDSLATAFRHNSPIVNRFALLGIATADEAVATLEQLENLGTSAPVVHIDHAVHLAHKLRQKAIFAKAPDFFPTPEILIDRMLDLVDIQPHHRTLEPSAGGGDICLALRDRGVSNIDTFEWNTDLSQALTLLGFPTLGNNFLTATPRPIYDRIVMNPPFSKDDYIEHIRLAFHWLTPGGQLIAVAPSGFVNSKMKRREQFADWLSANDAEIYDNPDNSFSKSDRSCGVSTKLIHLTH